MSPCAVESGFPVVARKSSEGWSTTRESTGSVGESICRTHQDRGDDTQVISERDRAQCGEEPAQPGVNLTRSPSERHICHEIDLCVPWVRLPCLLRRTTWLEWWTTDSDFTELKEAHPAFRNARSGPAPLYTPSEGRCGLSGIPVDIRYLKRVAGPSILRHRASARGYAVVQVFM